MKLRNKRKFTNHKKRIMYFSLFFLLLFISIGYAYLSASLSINGNTTIAANTWDIHFANLSITNGSVAASTPAAIQSNTTNIVYSVELSSPGDYYEFSVDVVNDGTISGKISLVNIQGISSAAESYLETSIKYTNGDQVQVDDLLNPGVSKRIIVRVGYIEDLNSLPEDDIELDLDFNVDYSQTNEEEVTTDTIIQQLKTENSSCFLKYSGQVTDQVGQTVTANNVYFNECADKRNIIFGGFCWQMIRTTETGGIKMIYNGEPVDGKCESDRENHKGIVGTEGENKYLVDNYLYGTSFIYDIITNEFTLIDTFTETWSDSTYENLIGKFTCKSSSDTCTTIYQINGYSSNTHGGISAYTISDTNYTQIGISPFNAGFTSPAKAGYMFNKVYEIIPNAPTSGSLVGNDVSYENGTYTLLPASGESTLGTSLNNTHHYTCNNTTGTCNQVRYYYYKAGYSNYYITLDGEENIDEAVNNMLFNDNVNRYNSSAKGVIDAWYKQNMINKTNKLEDTVYCNARNMINQSTNGWNKDGSLTITIQFKNYTLNNDLSCANETDQFAVGNIKAKLTYPVGLLQDEERNNINTLSLVGTEEDYWTFSPSYFEISSAGLRYVYSSGGSAYKYVDYSIGLRPVVSLRPDVVITEGTGSEADPWIVE